MVGVMETIGIAVCYVLAAGVIMGCIAFVILAERFQMEENTKK